MGCAGYLGQDLSPADVGRIAIMPRTLIVTEMFAPVTDGSRFFRPDGRKQVAELVLDLLGGRDRLRDFGPDQLGITPPQAMDGHLERLRAHAQLASEHRVRLSCMPR